MEKRDYTIGLDIGIGSVGWAAIDQKNANLIDMGIRLFETATEASVPRKNRSARRTLRRNKWRRDQMKNAFVEYGLISKEDINDTDFLSFTANNSKYTRPIDDTIYHLRKRALKEKVSKRELFLCLYNICKTRGHFLLEDIDFSKGRIPFEEFRDRFYEYTENYVSFVDNRSKFEEKLLKPIYKSDVEKKVITSLIKSCTFTNDESSDKALEAIIFILEGYTGDLSVINDALEKGNINKIKKKEILSEFEDNLIILYDLINIAQLLSEGCNYLCEVAVDKIDEYKNKFLNREKDLVSYEDLIKKLESINDSKTGHIRSVKNIENSRYPNGMYVKEATDILHKQSEFYSEIDNTFIEICSSIISARIPYYIGPLAKKDKSKNAWVIKNNNFKYSYDYSIKHLNSANELESIKEWKRRMISHCTYLPEYEALPKGSFIGETFSILNELNSYDNDKTEDANGQTYYLTTKDKIKIFNELFLAKKETVKFEDIKNLLNLKYFGSKKGTTLKFNNTYTLYKNIASIIPDLKLNGIEEIFNNKDKINKIEDIILNINLFNEEESKIEFFESKAEYRAYARKLAKLKSSSFYNFSKEFITETTVDIDGNSILDKMFEDNSSNYTNNLMYIISTACDTNGEKIDFISNKYEKVLKENDCKLDVDLLLQNGKPLIPISRPTIRALNEALKIYQGIINTYGIPNKIVIETARGEDSIKDFTVIDEKKEKHVYKVETLYNYLKEQFKNKENNDAFFKNDEFFNKDGIEKFEDIKGYYENNKQKIELYIRQNGRDLLTGKVIDIKKLHEYEIDHILPRGFQDDSMNDKILIHKVVNAKKSNRVPIEFLESSDAAGLTTMTVSRYINIVSKLYDMKLISENKKKRLLLANTKDVEGFVNQNLVDTRYVIREFMSIINAYNKINSYQCDVSALRGAFTYTFRKAFKVEKSRNLGDQHHAIDAAILCIADACLQAYYPNYNKRGNFEAYSKFVSSLMENEKINADESNELEKNYNTIRGAYHKAFNQSYTLDTSLLSQVMATIPLYSHKVEKNWIGKLSEINPSKPLDENDKSVLSVIGMNNGKRSFSKVNCVAVDFYRVKKNKNKTIHYAVHIPYAIINQNGVIDKNKYLKLVKEFYEYNDLIDENGELKTHLFRFRAFQNDIIYDTYLKTPMLFSLGSMEDNKTAYWHINNFSYDEIYRTADGIANFVIKDFNIKTRKQKNGIKFSELDKKTLLTNISNNYYPIENFPKYEKELNKRLANTKNIYDFVRQYIYLARIANKKFTPPEIYCVIRLTANNNSIKIDPNAEYIKLKYDILGIRYSYNNKGNIIINSAHGTCGKYSKIKKEDFEWKISKYSVQ